MTQAALTTYAQELGVPEQKAETILLTAERYSRSCAAMEDWATEAKTCVQFAEGEQWSAEDLKNLDEEGRPAFTFNKVAPLVRLVLGYQRNNRTDTRYLPGSDGSGIDAVAQALTQQAKQISEANQEPYVDAEVFMDGILTGRAYKDFRLCFEKNDFGDVQIKTKDPFSIKLDPDADEYDINTGSYVMEDRWVSIDEIAYTYGKGAAALVAPMLGRQGSYSGYSGMPANLTEYNEEITPWRTFGGGRGLDSSYASMEAFLTTAYDPMRKNVRLIDQQHYIRVLQRCIVDLETGDREPIPDHYTQAQVQKILDWATYKYQQRGQLSPLRAELRRTRRVRWTTMVGDIVVFDGWSPYETFTLVPFFPYFRRGKTRGMVNDLLDPQREVNKRRSAEIDIVTRTANSGWLIHENGVSKEEREKIERYGAAPGINIFWHGDDSIKKPQRIDPAVPPTAMSNLEQKANQELKEISGVNDSLLGVVQEVQSGRALEAKQKGAIMAIQMYMDNMIRTNHMCGVKKLEMIQNHYTEQRIVRTLGTDGKPVQTVINQRMAAGQIVNDVTTGKYTVSVDETPLSASFMSAQFEDMKELIEMGVIPVQIAQDVAIEASSVPQKELLKTRVKAMMAAQGIPSGDNAGMQQIDPATGQPMAPTPMRPPGMATPIGGPGRAVQPETEQG